MCTELTLFGCVEAKANRNMMKVICTTVLPMTPPTKMPAKQPKHSFELKQGQRYCVPIFLKFKLCFPYLQFQQLSVTKHPLA